MLTHPENCGKCGNKCESGYCWKGQCYTPEPDACIPTETGLTNGDFSSSDGWNIDDSDSKNAFTSSYSASEGLSLVANVAATTDPFNAISTLRYTQDFKLCPNTVYEFHFQMKHVAGTSPGMSILYFCLTKHLDAEVVPGRVHELHADRDSATVSINIAGKGQGVVVPSATSNNFASYGPYKWGPWTADSPGIQRVDGSLTTQFRFSVGVSGAEGNLKSEVHFKGLELNAVSS